jgi:hypothetical protein
MGGLFIAAADDIPVVDAPSSTSVPGHQTLQQTKKYCRS